MKEFKLNEYITLKLEGDQTNIYVEDQLFNHCKYLLINLTPTSNEIQTDINSVDGAAEQLGWTFEGQKQNFTIELYSNYFQVSIVFPFFPSIDKLKKQLKLKSSEIITRVNQILGNTINNQYNHIRLQEIVKDSKTFIHEIPVYKIRIFDHYFINIGERHWIPRAEIVIDPQTLKDDVWFSFLEQFIELYHPERTFRDKKWGAGLHILKEYPRGSDILLNPDDLINDIRETLLDFYKIAEIFVS